MNEKIVKLLNEFKILLMCGAVVLVTQIVGLDGKIDVINAIIGLFAMILVSLVSLKIKELTRLPIPAFAWASLLALLLTLPWSPVQEVFLSLTAQIGAGQIGTVILAMAGVSIGLKLRDIKKLSWKIVIVAIAVFVGTFFGSALIAQLVLSAQGVI